MNKLRKFSIVIMSAVILSMTAPILMPAAESAAAQTTPVKISKKAVTLTAGKTVTLKVSGTKKAVKWSTSNKAVATVTQKGTVKAIKKGTAKITATVDKKKYICTVTVKAKPVENTSVKNAPFAAREAKAGGLSFVIPKNYKEQVLVDVPQGASAAYFPDTYADAGSSPGGIVLTIQKTATPAVDFETLKGSYDPLIDSQIEALKATGVTVLKYDKSTYESKNGKALKYEFEYEIDGKKSRQVSYMLSINKYLVAIDIINEGGESFGKSPDIFGAGTYMLDTVKAIRS